jgi:hypothetical protein
LQKVRPQRLLTQLGTFDGERGVVGVGGKQGTVVGVESPPAQYEQPDRAPGR